MDDPPTPPPPVETLPEPTTGARRGRAQASAGDRITERVRLVRPLGEGGMSEVWVAAHDTLGIEVAVKLLLRPEDEAMVARLSREAQLAAQIDHPHAVRVLDHGLTLDGVPFLVMELIEGESLAERLERGFTLSLEETVTLVQQVAEVLDYAHARGIVHRDIKPANVMLLAGRDALFTKVVDFGIAKALESRETTVTHEGQLVGTPLYMAPEQLFDGREAERGSDVWALALIAYEALTGRRPFPGRTRAAVGLAIVTQRYERISALSDAPPSLDEVFARAFELDVDARYATARELAEAFATAARAEGGGAVSTGPSALSLPAALYGRDAELATLRGAYQRAAEGCSEVALVSGLSGVGKSSLVSRALATLAGSGARFASGKFDQFERGTPYRPLLEALRRLVRRAHRRADSDAVWRRRLADGLGDGGATLAGFIPELARLIGPQPPAEDVSPSEAKNRFQAAVRRLATSMANADEPLVLFLDDLQWADLPSLELLASLATDPESRHVLLLGAYRRDEVDELHPLTDMIATLRAARAPMSEIALGPLDEDAVLDLIADAFPRAAGRARLAAICRDKTRGNPFFLRRFLESLHDEGAIAPSPDGSGWTFDLPRIETRALTEEVEQFVEAEVRRLPPRSLTALAVAACIGDEFDLEILAAALGAEVTEALDHIRPALENELVVAPSDAALTTDGLDAETRITLRFVHDKIRAAARTALVDEEAVRVHRVVGMYLLDHLEGSERERRLFELVEHLNRGEAGQSSPSARARLRALNLAAARRAMESAAFEAAHAYGTRAHALMDADAWTADYDQTFAIHHLDARAAYLSGDYDVMRARVSAVEANANDALDRVAVQEITIQSMVSQQRFAAAVKLTRRALEELGHALPESPTDDDIAAAIGETLAAIGDRTTAQLASLPRVADPRVAAVRRIQNGGMSSAYLAVPKLLPVLACRIVRSTLEHGVSRESPYGLAVLGLVLVAMNEIDRGYALGRAATEMLDRIGERSVRPKTLHVVAAHIRLFVEPLRDAIEADRVAARLGADTGDLEFAAWALHCMVANSLYAGAPLAQLEAMCRDHVARLEHQRQLAALGCTVQYTQVVENLLGRATDPARLVGPDYDERAHMKELEAKSFRGAAFILTTLGTYVRYLFGDAAAALAWADRGGVYADGATSTFHPVWWHQYRTLARLATVDPGDDGAVAAARHDVDASLTQLRVWRAASERTHAHRVLLVEAELFRLAEDPRALAAYHAAAEAARAGGFVHEEALAHELEAKARRAAGDLEGAREAVSRARDRYAAWGAAEKVRQLTRDE